MTFEFYGFEPGPKGSDTSITLTRLYPPDDADELPPSFPRNVAKQKVEAIFDTLIADPNNAAMVIVVFSSTCGNNIVAAEYPSAMPPSITEQMGRKSRWLKWIVDPSAEIQETPPKKTG